MGRIILGAIGGFIAWMVLWVGSEMILSIMAPVSIGFHQAAFQAALKNGGQFTADTTLLLSHIMREIPVTLAAGFLAALIAAGNRRAPLVLGILLLVLGVMKATMSWPYVPVWYHIAFTALLLPMALVGGRARAGKAHPLQGEQS